jgi:hypothetical protein
MYVVIKPWAWTWIQNICNRQLINTDKGIIKRNSELPATWHWGCRRSILAQNSNLLLWQPPSGPAPLARCFSTEIVCRSPGAQFPSLPFSQFASRQLNSTDRKNHYENKNRISGKLLSGWHKSCVKALLNLCSHFLILNEWLILPFSNSWCISIPVHFVLEST